MDMHFEVGADASGAIIINLAEYLSPYFIVISPGHLHAPPLLLLLRVNKHDQARSRASPRYSCLINYTPSAISNLARCFVDSWNISQEIFRQNRFDPSLWRYSFQHLRFRSRSFSLPALVKSLQLCGPKVRQKLKQTPQGLNAHQNSLGP